jgi:hypothetical protein
VPVLREPEGVTGHTVACHWAEQILSGQLQPASSEASLMAEVGPEGVPATAAEAG